MNMEFDMLEVMSTKELAAQLPAPEQDLARLSFCANTKAASVFDWIHSIPLTQVDQASAIFYNALPELARVKANYEVRLAILETVRTPLHQCLENLSKRYLNQPLIMPESAVKTATVSQALQKHLLNGYLVVIRDICINPRDKEHHLALAIYRALSCLSYLLMRSLQLYLPPADNLWRTAHLLFLITESLDLSHEPCTDPLLHQHQSTNTAQAYIRLLLLAAARPNQLRQEEIQQVFTLLESAANLVTLEPLSYLDEDNSLITLTKSDLPPLFLSKAKQQELPLENSYQLNIQNLIQALNDFSQSNGEIPQITPSVIQHLHQAWKQQSQRNFPRQVTRLNIEVIVGVVNIHYYLCGEVPFQIFLQQETALKGGDGIGFKKQGVQLKSSQSSDPWDDPFDIKDSLGGMSQLTTSIEQRIRQQALEQYQGQHQIYSIPLIDKSPGGYGLEWHEDIPTQVKTGEIIALKEQNRPNWSLGVIRWAHQIKGASQLGVQILSPKATPAGIALIHRTGGYTEYLRGLLVPELRAINQPPSLITNAITFHEGSKVKLYTANQEQLGLRNNIQLTKRLFSTGAFTQFGYRMLSNLANDEDL